MLDSLQTILDTIDGVVWGPLRPDAAAAGTGILLTTGWRGCRSPS
ncbi:hypothetical protein QJS66_18100 [Kocuria rhizophila]|nr:hypothetical protein QJS66_18100 [Kocuria rhizophila]